MIGIVLATILGTLVGIARLSSNWLLSRLAAVYVEALRDIPLLLQLLFWYVLMQGLPPARGAWKPIDGVFLSNRGLIVAVDPARRRTALGDRRGRARLVLFYLLRRKLIALQVQDGKPRRIWPYGIAAGDRPAGAGLVAARRILGRDVAGVARLQFRRRLDVRAGIFRAADRARDLHLGLHRRDRAQRHPGRAAGDNGTPPVALGLRRSFVLRQIVLPQALRVIIPPMTSQYLNLTKNSSLAVAIGYQDIVSIANTTLNQTGQAIEAIALIMAVFLTISLGISLFMNWYNAHIALVER